MADTNQRQIIFDSSQTELTIRKRTGKSIHGSFSAIGPLSNRKRAMQPDVFDLLDQVSKGAFSVFNNLKYNREENTNITQYLSCEELNKSDKELLSRRLKELKSVGLIKNVPKKFTSKDPRKVFIINPDIIKCSDHSKAIDIWNYVE